MSNILKCRHCKQGDRYMLSGCLRNMRYHALLRAPVTLSSLFPTIRIVQQQGLHACETSPKGINSPSRRSIGDATLAGRNRKAQQRPIFIAGAFFVPAMSCYGGGARDTFGCAGLLSSRSANPRTAATSTCLAASGGSSTTKGTHACPPIPHPGSPHPLPTAG